MRLKMIGKPKDKPSTVEPRVDLDKLEEVEHWCRKLGCSPFDLRNAVLETGGRASALQAYANKKSGSNPG